MSLDYNLEGKILNILNMSDIKSALAHRVVTILKCNITIVN